MRILIIGSGSIGVKVASALVGEGHNVVLIDANAERQARLDGTVDCMLVTGNATDPQVLLDAGVRGADLMVAVTGVDEVNMAVCRMAEHFGVVRRLARLRHPAWSSAEPPVPLSCFGIDAVFSPEAMAADMAERIIATPGAVEAMDMADGRLALRGFPVPHDHPLLAGPLRTVASCLPPHCQVVAVKRGDRVLIPSGNDQLNTHDIAYLLGPPEQVEAMVRLMAPDRKAPRCVVVFGAGPIGVELARRLRRFVPRVVLFGPDATRAARAAEVLDPLGIEVIEGSALDQDLLHSVGAEQSDHLVSLSDDDENNLMASLLYRRHSTGSPILMTQKNHYADMFEMLGLPVVIEPRALATSAILRVLRGGAIVSFTRLHHDDAEVLEATLSTASPLVGKPLAKLHLPGGMRIAAVVGNTSVTVPDGATVLAPGDRVLAVIDSAAGTQVRRWLR